jgi:hypothetical protein
MHGNATVPARMQLPSFFLHFTPDLNRFNHLGPGMDKLQALRRIYSVKQLPLAHTL